MTLDNLVKAPVQAEDTLDNEIQNPGFLRKYFKDFGKYIKRAAYVGLTTLALAAPAKTAITFSLNCDGHPTLQIYYSSDSGDVVRGINLEVTIDSGGQTSNADVTVAVSDYNCYIDYVWDMEKEGGPGGYNVGDGDGPLANADTAGSLTGSASHFAISMGVLDQTGNQKGAEPGASRELLLSAVIGPPGVYTVTIKGDTTRGSDSGVAPSTIETNLSGGRSIHTLPCPPPPPEFSADINNDNIVNYLDLAIVANDWLRHRIFFQPPLPGDINEDNYVNTLDFAILAEQWLVYSYPFPFPQ